MCVKMGSIGEVVSLWHTVACACVMDESRFGLWSLTPLSTIFQLYRGVDGSKLYLNVVIVYSWDIYNMNNYSGPSVAWMGANYFIIFSHFLRCRHIWQCKSETDANLNSYYQNKHESNSFLFMYSWLI